MGHVVRERTELKDFGLSLQLWGGLRSAFQLFCWTLGLPVLVPVQFQSHPSPMPSSSLTIREISESPNMPHLGILIPFSLFPFPKTPFPTANLLSILVSTQTSPCQRYSSALTLGLYPWGPHACVLLSTVSLQHTVPPLPSAWPCPLLGPMAHLIVPRLYPLFLFQVSQFAGSFLCFSPVSVLWRHLDLVFSFRKIHLFLQNSFSSPSLIYLLSLSNRR